MLKVGEIQARAKKIAELKEAIKGIATYEFNEKMKYVNSKLIHTKTKSKISFDIDSIQEIKTWQSGGVSIKFKGYYEVIIYDDNIQVFI